MRASWREDRRGTGLTHTGTVYVLYNRRLSVLVLLLVLLATSVGAVTVGMNRASEKFGYDGSCLVTASTNLMLVVWYASPVAVSGHALTESHEGCRRWRSKQCFLR